MPGEVKHPVALTSQACGCRMQPGTECPAANQGPLAAPGDGASPEGPLTTAHSITPQHSTQLHGTHPTAHPLPTIPHVTLALSRPRCCVSPSLGHQPSTLCCSPSAPQHPALGPLPQATAGAPHAPPALRPHKGSAAGHRGTLSPATGQAAVVTPGAPLPPGARLRPEQPREGTRRI